MILWASSRLILRKQTVSPGFPWTSLGMSKEHTVAILAYPPVVCLSARSTMGLPLAGTWTAPKAMPSEMMSVPSTLSIASPSRRYPILSLWSEIVYRAL